MSTAAPSSLALAGSPALRLLPGPAVPGPAVPARPALRVIEGGRAPSRLAQRARYRRRRVVAVALLAVLVTASVLLVGAISARLAGGGHPSSAVGTPSPAPSGSVHIVQPGDTLWSIAAALEPGADVRATVDELVALNGRGPLEVGARLRLP